MSGNIDSANLFRHGRFGAQRTPEPCADGDAQMPSTPRPRFKLKRRHDPLHLAAPTQQFLASVAAADIPMPSVEEPAIATFETDAMHPWSGFQHLDEDQDVEGGLHIQCGGDRSFSPPKTPALGDPPSLTPSRYPNWSIDCMSSCESSPEPTSRPSTARSRTSSASFSQLSTCFSDEQDDDIQFSPGIRAPSDGFFPITPEDERTRKLQPHGGMSRLPRKALWTKAMGQHLWATYNMYLSDPRVTPFQISKSGLPPEGVCQRVARQAIRSWKGSKAAAKPTNAPDAKSGSSTPTAESCGVFMQWPHTSAATRAYLRALCKQKARGPDGGKMRFSYFSRSPTPFTNATARWARRSTPGSAVLSFETQAMSKSLAISTSDTMKPEGPLAQLTDSVPESSQTAAPTDIDHLAHPIVDLEPSLTERRRLGSPINAKSYGPSSSASLSDAFGLSADAGERRTHTVGPQRRLQSPVRLSRSSTQKRRTKQAHEARKRPSLSVDTWLDPRFLADNETDANMFNTNNTADQVRTARRQTLPSIDTGLAAASQQRAVQIASPPRLGSPFSFSVPNRFSQPCDFEASLFGRRFSTVHQPCDLHTNEPAVTTLASRLAYIDQRLKDFNAPHDRWRPESPL
ncbi:hypothetical protein VP1G_10120 [Cytospora mali]|uniref:Uncharacterized protein n=1 Tax=Cytospora mali TaxID=578113 RepID=A0A194VGJ7_CYTMA|nr:hypothetical protein VP1G_10120 [Valsa mali var. pyri (nom. inval.)]